MLGHAAIGFGAGNDGRDSIAVWHVSPDCRNVGAWIFAREDAFHDTATAERIAAITSGRALAGWDNTSALEALAEIHRVAGRTTNAPHSITLPEILAEIAETRADFLARAQEERERSKNLGELAWTVLLPDDPAGSPEELRRSAGLAAPPGSSPAADDALLTSLLLNWCLHAWQDTMAALSRKYLRETFGDPRELPAKWETALREAYLAERQTAASR